MPSLVDYNAQAEFLDKYIAIVRGVPPDESGSTSQLVLVLKTFRHALKARSSEKRPSVEWIETMTTGTRLAADLLDNLAELESEALGDWQEGKPVQNDQQALAGILIAAIRTLCADIAKGERLYPELTTHFHDERAKYYEMKCEVLEADRCE